MTFGAGGGAPVDPNDARSMELLAAGRLPLRAQQRLADAQSHHSFTSNISVGEFAAVRSVGFDPVGQVMGTSVYQLGYSGSWNCGAQAYYGGGMGYRGMGGLRMSGGIPGTFGGGIAGGVGGGGYQQGVAASGRASNYEQALRDARWRAMNRLTEETSLLGGDGVIGVELRVSRFLDVPGAVEFQAIGTAIRGRGNTHPREPFLTDLSGQDFAKLLHGGWVPCGFAFSVACVVRHDDYRTRAAASSLNYSNVEVPGYTQLVGEARAISRRDIADEVARHGGQGAVVSAISLRIHEQECALIEGGRDHLAESWVFATVIAPLGGKRTATVSLPVMRLQKGRRWL